MTLRSAIPLVIILVFTCLTGPAPAETDVRIRVTTEGQAVIRIYLEEPTAEIKSELRDYHAEFMKVLRTDLDVSGYFEVLNSPDDDAQAIVAIEPEGTGGRPDFDIDLRDKPSQQSIFRRRYGAEPGRIGATAHVVADDIVYALTGRMGIANTRLVFVAGPKGKSHLYTVHIDGSQLHRLTEIPNIVMSPCWSPTGARVAYVSYDDRGSAVYVVDLSDMTRTKFASFEGMNATPAWSPDGKMMAMTLSKDGNPEIYIFSLDGSVRKRLTFYSGIDCSPSWAPNGLELAFTSDRAGVPQIYVTDVEGLNLRRITFEGSYNTSPAWSPEGDLIAYVSRVGGRFQICTVDPFGIASTVLTGEGNNEDPEWSPDGMHIVFSSTGRSDSGIYIMNRDGSAKHLIFEGLEHPRNPAWSYQPGYAGASRVEG
jgi:TolB protein